MALKKLKKEGEVVDKWSIGLPPPFRSTVSKMRKVLLEFSEGDRCFEKDAVSAMEVYCS